MKTILALIWLLCGIPSFAASVYTVRLEDREAVYVSPSGAEDADTIQSAIDREQAAHRAGIVFLAEGTYRLTRTIYVWPMIRLIGYGAHRPVLSLPEKTPGYGDPENENYLIFFAGSRTDNYRQVRPPDANPGTFYSALSNVDVEIGHGNPGAVAVRGTYAQHCFLAHIDFHIGEGLAAVHDTGNVMEDVRFFGGRYGVWTRTPSPGWQLTLVDSFFSDQREAAIREQAAGLTLVRPHFENVPSAVTIDQGFPDDLWIKDAYFDHIRGPALVISLENNPRTEINLENAVCNEVPVFALYNESGKRVNAPSSMYRVKSFSHGLAFDQIDSTGEIRELLDIDPLHSLPEPAASDLAPLPPTETWVNVRTLGAKGDGVTDDTTAFRQAIAKYRAVYVPSGFYTITGTLQLRPDTVLVGLHPLETELDVPDGTAAFQGVGSPVPLIEAPEAGANILSGIGLYTNGINPRAVAAKWMSGAHSLMNDVRFLGGHGTVNPDATRQNPYNNDHTADPDSKRRWDSQYPSLWVTNGGGGTFFDIWTPSTFAQAGMFISDTSTQGRVYEISSEHHVRNELIIRRAANWSIYAPQTEEERGESGSALPIEIDSSKNITIANYHCYRVISSYQPFPYAIRIRNSSGIRFRNVHAYSNSKVSFDASIVDETNKLELRDREFAYVDVNNTRRVLRTPQPSSVEKLADGFFNISGGAAGPNGDFYFVDAHRQTIYRYSADSGEVSVVRNNPLEPVNLAFDRTGNLMVVSYGGDGTVYTFNPATPGLDVSILPGESAASHPGMTAVLAVGDWRFHNAPRAVDYISPDRTTFIAGSEEFAKGTTSWGVKSADLLRSFGLAKAAPGEPFYVTSEAEITTWAANVDAAGNLRDVRVFANRGGESVAPGPDHKVYLAAGQIYVYDVTGKPLNRIDVPQRPVQLVFGGNGGRTLFIVARTALYAIRDVSEF